MFFFPFGLFSLFFFLAGLKKKGFNSRKQNHDFSFFLFFDRKECGGVVTFFSPHLFYFIIYFLEGGKIFPKKKGPPPKGCVCEFIFLAKAFCV